LPVKRDIIRPRKPKGIALGERAQVTGEIPCITRGLGALSRKGNSAMEKDGGEYCLGMILALPKRTGKVVESGLTTGKRVEKLGPAGEKGVNLSDVWRDCGGDVHSEDTG